MSDKGVCRTALVTLGLLNILVSDLATLAQKWSKITVLRKYKSLRNSIIKMLHLKIPEIDTPENTGVV